IAMICTFGDTTDVVWWRELGLPVRNVMGHDGRLREVEQGELEWQATDPGAAREAYAELQGKTSKQAQTRIVELLDESGGFIGDPDVMDTWASSSMSPEFVSGWERDPDLFARTFPMDLRPQAHEIIRTWLFYTVVRAELEFQKLPFSDVAISGFVRDPDRKKLSKSAGNSPDDPYALIDTHGADAIRYWACGARPGRDLELDRNQFKIGRRLAIKILNASKFVLSRLGPEGEITAPLDNAMLAKLADVVD